MQQYHHAIIRLHVEHSFPGTDFNTNGFETASSVCRSAGTSLYEVYVVALYWATMTVSTVGCDPNRAASASPFLFSAALAAALQGPASFRSGSRLGES